MNPFLQKLFGMKPAQPGWLNLESDALKFQREVDGVRVWQTDSGDSVGAYFFGVPPDLPAQSREADFLAAYKAMVASGHVHVVACELSTVSGLRALQCIIKAPQQPSGRAYLGALTFAWRDFSYVVKVQCAEHGMTGLREAVLLERALAARGLAFGEAPDLQQLVRDIDVDSSVHDEGFPDHPVTRTRRHLRTIADAVRLHDALRAKVPFQWPH